MTPRSRAGSGIAAVVFDLDGVLIDSEVTWAEIKKRVAVEAGGQWHANAQREMLGMSSVEWSNYMRDQLGVPMDPEWISSAVAERVADSYRAQLPLLPGAIDAVRALAARWPLAVASSSNRPLIDLVVELTGLTDAFEVTVSSEEVGGGKPAPDVYLEAARRLGVDPAACAAVEDSANGVRSAYAAGMAVIAIPNRDFPPEPDALRLATKVLGSLAELTPGLLTDL